MSEQLIPAWLKQPNDVNALAPNLWPTHLERAATGELAIAGVGVDQLVGEYGTPLFVIDEADFRARATSVRKALEVAAESIGTTAKVYYASKVFLNTEIASWVEGLGLNIDVASGGELAVALAAGFPAERIGLHGNNKSLYEIGRAVTAGVGAIVIDSEIEIERIASAAGAQDRVQPVRLRVNAGVHAHTHEFLATAREDQKFGIALADVPELVAKIRSHSHLKFLGLHSHIGSQIFTADAFEAAADRLIEVQAQLLVGGEVPELNLGGGFGINYTSADNAPDIAGFAALIAESVAKACQRRGIAVPRLAFEPGRVIAGPSTITLYSVGTIKDVALIDHHQGATRKYVSVDGGMSDNLRTALYQADYTPVLASRQSTALPVISRVVGKHCESGDIVVRDAFLPSDIAPTDLLAVAATGAYCYSLANNYNYLTRPAVVAVRDGKSRLVVRAETEADLLGRDVKYQQELKNSGKATA